MALGALARAGRAHPRRRSRALGGDRGGVGVLPSPAGGGGCLGPSGRRAAMPGLAVAARRDRSPGDRTRPSLGGWRHPGHRPPSRAEPGPRACLVTSDRVTSNTSNLMARTLVVSCRDWPVRALGVPPGQPAAVLVANLVLATTPAARRAGVVPGLRRREAQSRCPDLATLERDPAQEGRAFEAVVAAVERFTPLVEVSEPGTCAVGTRGPSRYHGGDEALAGAVQRAVRDVLAARASASAPGASAPAASAPAASAAKASGRGSCRVGVADGWFAAAWAARRSTKPLVVPPGESAAFLAPLPLGALEQADLVEVLWQLGLRTLGDLAALPETDVLGRFGPVGAHAHRLARGGDDRPLDARRPPPDLAASRALDPPLERVDQAAFVVRGLAEELAEHLARLGLACTRVAVEVETEHDESLVRLWRDEGALTPGAIVERARWQLDGWLSGP
ncbi:MAG: hypothetical protein GEV08_05645, partial [Acidimicrobiia bacterium]|nr:hypothetical protein [Acidimicrobiia bacterium]